MEGSSWGGFAERGRRRANFGLSLNACNRKNMFRSCFPAFSVGETPLQFDKPDRRNTRNNGRFGKTVSMAVSGRKGRPSMPDVNLVNVGDDLYSNRSSRRGFVSRLLKTVLFDSLMVKKIHKSCTRSSISSQNIEPFLQIEKTGKSSDMEDSSSRCSSLLSSTTSRASCSSYLITPSSSSTNSTSQQSSNQNAASPTDSDPKDLHRLDSIDTINLISTNSVRKLNSVKIYSGRNNWNVCLCMFLLLSLVVLMVYGRIYSILCTSTWFYFLPCGRIKRVNSVSTGAKCAYTESRQYKKRVIMAGLLDRARNPLR